MRPFALIFAIAVAMTSPARAQPFAVGSGHFEREEAAGATAERQRVFYHRPEARAPAGRIVVVMRVSRQTRALHLPSSSRNPPRPAEPRFRTPKTGDYRASTSPRAIST